MNILKRIIGSVLFLGGGLLFGYGFINLSYRSGNENNSAVMICGGLLCWVAANIFCNPFDPEYDEES